MSADNVFARFQGARIQHLLVARTKTTICGKDATLANRYPRLTQANSADRSQLLRLRWLQSGPRPCGSPGFSDPAVTIRQAAW